MGKNGIYLLVLPGPFLIVMSRNGKKKTFGGCCTLYAPVGSIQINRENGRKKKDAPVCY
jgi:hypothetical protein